MWTGIAYAYGDWKVVGNYKTKRDAMDGIGMAIGIEVITTKRIGNGEYTIDGRHLIAKTADLDAMGYGT